jgi:sugar (pentulose or hexulose) kinase
MGTFIGIDVGTSACRACAIDRRAEIVAEARTDLPAPTRDGACVEQDPAVWWLALGETLDQLSARLDTGQLQRLAIDATSATVLLCNSQGQPLTPALMYNDARAVQEAQQIAQVAASDSAALSPSSSLAKLLYLRGRLAEHHCLALHQADWLAGKFTGRFGISDANNALKMGYDPLERAWPDWMSRLQLRPGQLPTVVAPGTVIGHIDAGLAARWGWPRGVEVVAGTTDSTAGFIATGASAPGHAVTALGSTLVLKVLSDKPVFAARYGVYSHRLGERWLVGGASNAGGSVLRRFFTAQQIDTYSRLMQPQTPTGLDYYPLPAPGERFPVCDPALQPRLTPRPASDVEFLQGILEGLARIEQRGYERLAVLGAPYPERVISVGGGAGNAPWMLIRRQMLGVPVTAARHQEAAYGAALLARMSHRAALEEL